MLRNLLHRVLNTNLKSLYLPATIAIILCFSYAFSNKTYAPAVSIAVEKMNVLYLGVDNPITVAVAGVPSENIVVSSDDLVLTEMGEGRYIVTGKKPGRATIKVKGDGFDTIERYFRVKRIPDPIAKVLNSSGAHMEVAKMKASRGVQAHIECFDFQASCSIASFEMTHVPKQGDPVNSMNQGGRYTANSQAILEGLAVGDILYFDNIKCKCPGDQVSRAINSMVFEIR